MQAWACDVLTFKTHHRREFGYRPPDVPDTVPLWSDPDPTSGSRGPARPSLDEGPLSETETGDEGTGPVEPVVLTGPYPPTLVSPFDSLLRNPFPSEPGLESFGAPVKPS